MGLYKKWDLNIFCTKNQTFSEKCALGNQLTS